MTKTLTRRIHRATEARIDKELKRHLTRLEKRRRASLANPEALVNAEEYFNSDEGKALSDSISFEGMDRTAHTSRVRFEDGTEAEAEVITTTPMTQGTFEVK